ncbi:alcohol dehydrogenase catalytic domain-containing protein [Actinoplanes sp. KI2]|uniref:zinc-dependent alcohol dehydrogenase n=1 Tax=Actinoplanes sp. KI2 TaxID=2983315 RepID=UPI0021D5B736|nr:alcohol dehydrogenase catalytic domain-containing protein [Actinoplanes sp. KI2]MCU7726890.1 alcohol dehydrogenase catalytic domain-containing protein [Actinoplanes sp. KI2]
MRALVFTGPGKASVQEVPAPRAEQGQVVVDVERAGICGTDMELFGGEMSYYGTGQSSYPLRPGHEWCGTVTAVGDGVDESWLGVRVTGDTMVGCGECPRCRAGRHWVCAARHELGITDGLPGALATQLAFPAAYLHRLPPPVDATLGAMVEPGGNALRCVRAAAVEAHERLLVFGTGTIGLLVAFFARARGVQVHLIGRSETDLALPRALGFAHAWTRSTLPGLPWDGIVDATTGDEIPALALDLIEPGRRIVYIGLSVPPSLIDTRALVLKDVTAVGILGASDGLPGAIEAYADGTVDPRPLVAATVSLDEIAEVLAGNRPPGAGPKIHVDPSKG